MTHQRDQIIRAAYEAIKRGEPVEQVIANAVDSMNEWARLDVLTSMDPESYGVGETLTPEDLSRLAFPVASRRQSPPTPKPQGQHKDSDWWKT